MKKLLVIITVLLSLVLMFSALGEPESVTPEERFEKALLNLENEGSYYYRDNVAFALDRVTKEPTVRFHQEYKDYLTALLNIHDAGYNPEDTEYGPVGMDKLKTLRTARGFLTALSGKQDFIDDLGFRNLPLPQNLITYINGLISQSRGQDAQAIEQLNASGNVFDATERARKIDELRQENSFNAAMELYEQGSYAKAAEIFLSLYDYVDENGVFAEDMYKESRYQQCMQLYANKDYWKAAQAFRELEGYSDSAKMAEESLELHNLNHHWQPASCTSAKTCSECGATEGAALGHNWKEATCTEPKTCARCGATGGRALGHNWKNATCTEPKTCARCGMTEGRALGHDWKEATCTEPKTCARCGMTEGRALGHDWINATCTDAGICTRCGIEGTDPKGHNWKNATCSEPKTCIDCGMTEGRALGHVWQAATCTSPQTCTRCGTTSGNALGHNWQAATCTSPSTCTRCGVTNGNALGHVWQTATCTSPNTCTRCGVTSGNALGHVWQTATCTSPNTCTRCGVTSGNALGHNWQAATCTSPMTCTRCGVTSGNALGHIWQAATYYSPETCSRCGITRGANQTLTLSYSSNVGDYVLFGHYEQDNKIINGMEPIEWLVLDKNSKGAYLLLSKYCLDVQPYNTTYNDVTWEECTLRAWLNENFYYVAFDSNEQNKIIIATAGNGKASGYSEWNTDGGNTTKDKVFLFSYVQANKYLGLTWGGTDSMKSRASATAYAKAHGASTGSGYMTTEGALACYWWLRSPGYYQNHAALVYSDGNLDYNFVDAADSAVRPAIWVIP